MTLHNFDQLVDMVKGAGRRVRVVLAGSQDRHALEAVLRAEEDGLAEPLLVGDREETLAVLAALGARTASRTVCHEPDPRQAARRAVELIRAGEAQVLMKGAMQTGELLAPVVDPAGGLGAGRVMSHLVLNQLPRYHKLLATSDGGMLVSPTLEQKAALIRNAVELLRALGVDAPKVAVLAAVEAVNPKMPGTLEAAALKEMNLRGELRDCVVEGPISLDLALDREAAAAKNYHSPVAGDADLLVSPDITAGNILGKALVTVGGGIMAGVILGARAPVAVSSRGSSSREKYLSLLLAAAVAGAGER